MRGCAGNNTRLMSDYDEIARGRVGDTSKTGRSSPTHGTDLRHWGAVLGRWEIWIVWALGALALAAIPVVQGQTSVIWDMLNHHIYLGWIAEHPRFDRDLFAAGWQSYQYPYLYWPAYKLAVAGFSGVAAGVVLALLQSLAVPPIWLVARSLCSGNRAEDIAMRWLGVLLAFSGGLTLSLVDTTSNDLLAGVPLVWAIALGFMANDAAGRTPPARARLVWLSGLLAGVSVAFKLSNGPLALVLPVVWVFGPGGARVVATRIMLGGLATLLGFVIAYAPWGWQLWQQFGNPVYAWADPSFEPLRALLGWHRP